MPSTHTLAPFQTRIADSSVHYTQAGSGELLLLIHGSLCDYRYWRWQIPALSQHMHVVAPSLRGFWPQAFDREESSFSVAQHTCDMIAFAQQLADGKPLHLLGHSRGAQIALELACVAPELVRSLTLADPGFRIGDEPPNSPFHMNVATLLEQGKVEEALSQFIDTVNGAGTWRQMVGWFKAMVTDNAYTLLSQVREINRPVDLERASHLRCPILLVGGANSPARYGSRIDILERAFTDVSRVSIPLASHGMNLANPKAFNQALLSFLTKTSR
ncbi:alpha/beta hydrolase [Candidimonas sp. SYP-B2681]|uniref:alpha/beta fold hydrolase n=1 Tax=Candidimonas sp. SYP-B2681 TaxID=2497686 RepID=UPI000F896B2B|nr:alpha/beta hydrolase [Candidimonas sp. SYP-B2681]RTZ40048.1 alpha/beta hydrolase [Candidimonas sp. SYP-B2681]